MNATAIVTAIWTATYTVTAFIGTAAGAAGSAGLLTQLGVFAVSIYIAWWFLNRESKNRQEQANKDAARETELLERINVAEHKYQSLLEDHMKLLKEQK